MATARVSFVLLGTTPAFDGGAPNIVRQIVGDAVLVSSIGSQSVLGPTAPTVTGQGSLYARIRARAGNIVVAAASASQTNGIDLLEGEVELIPVSPGSQLSFVELT